MFSDIISMINRHILLFALFCILCTLEGCVKDVDVVEPDYSLISDSVRESDILQRATVMAGLAWTPLDNVPNRNNGVYLAGKTYIGTPYSSVKEINTYIGQDVSFYTFMSAVHNSRSYLYTENISRPPYHGENCAAYYGAVCSSSLMYVMGIDIPYNSTTIPTLPFVKILPHQEIDSLKRCDIFRNSGHVFMIYNLEYDDGKVSRVSIFETKGEGSRIISYSRTGLEKIWHTYNYSAYRSSLIVRDVLSPDFSYPVPDFTFNDDLSTAKGDKVEFRTTDSVRIDILNHQYRYLVVVKNGVCYDSCAIGNKDYITYRCLPQGQYEAYLSSASGHSDNIYFEVVSTNVSVDNHGSLTVRFSSNATPLYALTCRTNGAAYQFYPISKSMRSSGCVDVNPVDKEYYYCKVVFKGKYGNIASKPIKLYR